MFPNLGAWLICVCLVLYIVESGYLKHQYLEVPSYIKDYYFDHISFFSLHCYRKNSKIWDTSKNCHNCPKNRKVLCNIALMHPKDADGMANSVDPDQTASSEAV